MARPLGISILGGLVILAAVILILISIASFVVGLAFVLPFRETGTTLLLNGLLYFAIGVVLGVAGSGLLRMRAWAWGLAILATLVTLVYVGYTGYQRSDRKSTRLNSSHRTISYAVFCLKKKNRT